MRLTVNGDTMEIEEGCTVTGLLALLQIGHERVAVEANLDIVPKASYTSHILQNGDAIEIVHFVGGGQGRQQ
jgi:thiamine biosynthesis protein ThiS